MNRQGLQNAVLAALTAGFNSMSQTVAADPKYRGLVNPVVIDFTGGSGNFIEMAIPKDAIEMTPLFDSGPAYLTLATGNADDSGTVRGVTFNGTVDVHLIGVLNHRDGAESSNTEAEMNAFEEAVWRTLNGYAAWPVSAGISYRRITRGNRGDLQPLSDGHRQWFELIASFMVAVS